MLTRRSSTPNTPSTPPELTPRLGIAALILALSFVLSACTQATETPEPLPPEETPEESVMEEPDANSGTAIIFDTDLGYDCDDAGALGVLHALADLGEANLLATMTVVGAPHSAGALDVINTYYGHPDVPVGAYMGERWADARPYWLKPDVDFLEPLVETHPSDIETRAQAQEAVALYRQTLAAQPDESVTVVTVGFLQNLADLLASSADAHSPLSGRALVAQKVKGLVVMGGRYPENDDTRDFNLTGGPEKDVQAAQEVIEAWPTPIVFSGSEIGDAIFTGRTLPDTLPENPVAHAYDLFPGTDNNGERASWDLTAVLYAVRGEEDLWGLRTDSHIVIKDDGSHEWQEGAVEPARISLELEAPADEVKAVLNELLAQEPASTSEGEVSREAR